MEATLMRIVGIRRDLERQVRELRHLEMYLEYSIGSRSILPGEKTDKPGKVNGKHPAPDGPGEPKEHIEAVLRSLCEPAAA